MHDDLKMIISKEYDYYFIKINTYKKEVETDDFFVFTHEKQYPFSVFVDIVPAQVLPFPDYNHICHHAALDNIHFVSLDFEEIQKEGEVEVTKQIYLKYDTNTLSVYALITNQLVFDDFFDLETEDADLIMIKKNINYGLITHNSLFANSLRYEYFSSFDLQRQIFELMLHVDYSNDNKKYIEKKLHENRMKRFGHILVHSSIYKQLADKKIVFVHE